MKIIDFRNLENNFKPIFIDINKNIALLRSSNLNLSDQRYSPEVSGLNAIVKLT